MNQSNLRVGSVIIACTIIRDSVEVFIARNKDWL